MLQSFELENFKAFGQSRKIEFAPITLIFGENSAGKSSLLQSLNLLKQTRESREQGVLLLPRSENGIVDLGSFHELLFDHDSSRTLRFRFNLTNDRQARFDPFDQGNGATYGFEIAFKREVDDNEVNLRHLKMYALIDGSDELISCYEPTEVDDGERLLYTNPPYLLWRGGRSQGGENVRIAKCTHITRSPSVWGKIYRKWTEQSRRVVECLHSYREYIHRNSDRSQPSLFQGENDFDAAIQESQSFYAKEFTIEEFIERATVAEIGNAVTLDGFIPVAFRMERSAIYPEFDAVRFNSRMSRKSELEGIDSALMLAGVGSQLVETLNSLFPMGPFRQAPKRLYIFTGTTPQDVGYDGNLLPDLLFRRKELVKETNDWLDRLQMGYHVQIKPVGTRQNDLFEVRLSDKRRKASIDVALSDVGFGISQLLPFVVQTLAAENQTITIEQPEVHVHPRLQSDLGDLLIAGIQSPRNHRFIVETHSEHLILRLLRRIRETKSGELPQGHPGLTPSDLSVIYLERGEEGAIVHKLIVNDDGDFDNEWPKGFFEERAKELF